LCDHPDRIDLNSYEIQAFRAEHIIQKNIYIFTLSLAPPELPDYFVIDRSKKYFFKFSLNTWTCVFQQRKISEHITYRATSVTPIGAAKLGYSKIWKVAY